jgi:hypothetical protein
MVCSAWNPRGAMLQLACMVTRTRSRCNRKVLTYHSSASRPSVRDEYWPPAGNFAGGQELDGARRRRLQGLKAAISKNPADLPPVLQLDWRLSGGLCWSSGSVYRDWNPNGCTILLRLYCALISRRFHKRIPCTPGRDFPYLISKLISRLLYLSPAMASRPLNDEEVLSEMNKMVDFPPVSLC